MMTVELAPGEAGTVHRHNANVFVYVLSRPRDHPGRDGSCGPTGRAASCCLEKLWGVGVVSLTRAHLAG